MVSFEVPVRSAQVPTYRNYNIFWRSVGTIVTAFQWWSSLQSRENTAQQLLYANNKQYNSSITVLNDLQTLRWRDADALNMVTNTIYKINRKSINTKLYTPNTPPHSLNAL